MRHDADEVEPTVAGVRPVPERRGSRRGRHVRRSRVRSWILALLASSAVLVVGVSTINTLVRPVEPAVASDAGSVLTIDSERAAADRASRDFARPDPSLSPAPSAPALSTSAPSAAPQPAAPQPAAPQPAAPQPAAPQPAAPQPAKLRPVAGLGQVEMDNAVAIVEAGKRMNVPKRASVVAVVTALQETRLRNLANSRVPQSLNFPHQGVGSNFDSVGLFQQRPSQGWGTAAELMDPATAAARFYARLVTVSGWETMSVGAAAQAVQRSAFPNAYAQHQPQAQMIVEAIF